MITLNDFQTALTCTAIELGENPDAALALLLEHDREAMQGMFKKRYPLQGRDWIRRIPAEDRQILVKIGLNAMQNGHMGGIARSKNAPRDNRGRFVKGVKGG